MRIQETLLFLAQLLWDPVDIIMDTYFTVWEIEWKIVTIANDTMLRYLLWCIEDLLSKSYYPSTTADMYTVTQ